jgi:hypothetical protein
MCYPIVSVAHATPCYPRVQEKRHRFERVIKHMEKQESVYEDQAGLPLSRARLDLDGVRDPVVLREEGVAMSTTISQRRRLGRRR